MSLRRSFSLVTPANVVRSVARVFSTTAYAAVKQMPPRPKVSEADITESFLHGSGPGGQKINKTSSAVQLIHGPTGMVVKSQATRSRSSNRKIARQLLAEKLEVLEKGGESRVMVKGEAKRKRKATASKKSRRKYRQLAESESDGDMKDLEEGAEEGGEEGWVDDEATDKAETAEKEK